MIGRRLLPLLVANGHHVTAMTRNPQKAAEIRAFGAEPAIADALDRDGVIRAVMRACPEAVVHQVTALGTMKSLRRFDAAFAATNRLRIKGTDYLLEGALAAGARRFIAQSFTNWPNMREGGAVKIESDPLDPAPPRAQRRSLDAIEHVERVVSQTPQIVGIALRYGNFYGPGTAIAPDGAIVLAVRRRQFPVVGGGAGMWSFIHVHDAAQATLLALTHGASGVYNITDDEPAAAADWLPELARILGAKPPFNVPAWLGWLLVGGAGVSMMTEARGSANGLAKRAFRWSLRYPTWRIGFRRELVGAPAPRRHWYEPVRVLTR